MQLRFAGEMLVSMILKEIIHSVCGNADCISKIVQILLQIIAELDNVALEKGSVPNPLYILLYCFNCMLNLNKNIIKCRSAR